MASTGLQKWEKYFKDGCITILKKASKLIFENSTLDLLSGTEVRVIGGEYESKPLVEFNNLVGRIKLDDLEKPIHLKKSVKFDLKPDKLGVVGHFSLIDYNKQIKSLINKNNEIPIYVKAYLSSLVDLAEKDNLKNRNRVKSNFESIALDYSLINTINKDFMEILGPLFSKSQQNLSGVAYFPVAGNEPLYDFKIIENNVEHIFSSKKSSGSTNTLKAAQIYSLSTCKKLKKLFFKELTLLEIIKESKVKEAPGRINEWLSLNFSSYEKSNSPQSSEDIVRLEAKVVKYINESDLNFIPLVKAAVPDLWYVKAELDKEGLINVKPIVKGANLTKAKLRGKSSPNHICDKLGFQL